MAATDAPSTPEELRELARRIPHGSPVECLTCPKRWESGDAYVEDGLRTLRAEYERIKETGEEDYALRYCLQWLGKNVQHLLPESDFELVCTCPGCHLERVRSKGAGWAAETAPGGR